MSFPFDIVKKNLVGSPEQPNKKVIFNLKPYMTPFRLPRRLDAGCFAIISSDQLAEKMGHILSVVIYDYWHWWFVFNPSVFYQPNSRIKLMWYAKNAESTRFGMNFVMKMVTIQARVRVVFVRKDLLLLQKETCWLQPYYMKDQIMGTSLNVAQTDNGDSLMKDIVEVMARALVDRPQVVSVAEINGAHSCIVELSVAKEDVGKIIGRQGRTANAMRTIVGAVSAKMNKRLVLEIID